jgi:metal-responsive CopG/Arc/MetJ family transcriptional regulator
MQRRSITLPDELDDTVDDLRDSRTSRSAWLQDAARVRLLLEQRGQFDDLLDELNSSTTEGEHADERDDP